MKSFVSDSRNLLEVTLLRYGENADSFLFDSGMVTFLNPYSYLKARDSVEIFERFRIGADGIFFVLYLRYFCGLKISRVSFDMTSLAPLVLADAEKKMKRVALVGTTEDSLKCAIDKIMKSYPEINIVSARNGYFSSAEERNEHLDFLQKLDPQVLIVGMGTPLQERFISDLWSCGWRGVGYTCGGFLHQTSKNIQYYPKWVDYFNLRWLYRIFDEPKLIRRYFLDYPEFVLVVMRDRFELTRKINQQKPDQNR